MLKERWGTAEAWRRQGGRRRTVLNVNVAVEAVYINFTTVDRFP